MVKGDDICSKFVGGGWIYYYNLDKKELVNVINEFCIYFGLFVYIKFDLDFDLKKIKEFKFENLSECELSNNEVKNKNKNSSEDIEILFNDNE